MPKQALVTYFYQSAFTVSLKKTLMIFSYRQTGLSQLTEELQLSEKDFHGFNNILVFVPSASLTHHDAEVIYKWKSSFPITYLICEDAKKHAPDLPSIRVCKEGDRFSVAQARVSVYGSTDAGVSFLVEVEDICVFHAGDLNLWHWREENTLREIARAEETFYDKVAAIPKDKIDICFFPLDPNQGGLYDAGANHLIMALRPRVFFPMHFANRQEIAAEYARRFITRRTVVSALTQVRESALVDLSGTSPIVRPTNPAGRQGTRRSSVDLAAYTQEDVFAQTDLPVSLDENGTV
ncbi:MAG: MBL fold metallo-hydrolase [Christensenellales bacterium]